MKRIKEIESIVSSKARGVKDRAYIGPAKAREDSRLRVSSCRPGNSNISTMKTRY